MATATDTLNHLVIVCCHAIYLMDSSKSDSQASTQWLLSPFQIGEESTYIEHMRKGLEIAESDPCSILVVSGSSTRSEVPVSEAQSYIDWCLNNSVGIASRLLEAKRLIAEEQALDSYGNVLYSMLKFWKQTSRWPEKITIIGFDFKVQRFMALHVPILKLNVGRIKVEYFGIDPPYFFPSSALYDFVRRTETENGEMVRGFKAWEVDLHGNGPNLRGKRRKRNPWNVEQFLFQNNEDRKRSDVKCNIVKWKDETGKIVREETLRWDQGNQPWE